ncbi:hypothetical protein CBR_g16986 [Chara braunii]|uniref:Uncharacterized protein n=1 Tax=Chara braunii TaxID=69332 RepID=A0A388KUM4_CHABU|nr:hypothetical protein CBR_g16986 [Chara braunii]|eukprot:GBG73643.1 hypothetical protein CBR_g16986 [Chara braunii]
MEQCTLQEVEVLKQRTVAEERKRLEAEAEKLAAEAEVAKLREQMEKLTTKVAITPISGMNLKTRLGEAAEDGGNALKTMRRGRPRAIVVRMGTDEGSAVDVNDMFTFLQIEKKRLRALKKEGLEILCKQEGITYKTVEMTADEIGEIRTDARFGKKDKETARKAVRHGVEEAGTEQCVSDGGVKEGFGLVGELSLFEAWRLMVVRRMRVVFEKNHSIGDIIYNFRFMANEMALVCGCMGVEEQFTRIDGHVRFRASEANFVSEWMRNARNIMKPTHGCSKENLRK